MTLKQQLKGEKWDEKQMTTKQQLNGEKWFKKWDENSLLFSFFTV